MCTKQGQKGFTLIELLVALAVLSASLTVLFELVSASLERSRKAEMQDRLSQSAQSLMAEVGSVWPVKETTQSGLTDEGDSWTLSMVPHDESQYVGRGALQLFLVTVEYVAAEDGPGNAFKLKSLRFSTEER